MIINKNNLLFEQLDDLTTFTELINLSHCLQFEEPIKDLNGKILIKEGIDVKYSSIEKLKEMQGSVASKYKIKITKNLLINLRDFLSKEIFKILEDKENEFIFSLYENVITNYKSYIRYSLSNSKLILKLFHIYKTNHIFFKHLAQIAIISLGILIQKFYGIKSIHHNTFLAGLCCDISYEDNDLWSKEDLEYSVQEEYAQKSAKIIRELKLATEISDAIQSHSIDIKELDKYVTKNKTTQQSKLDVEKFLEQPAQTTEGTNSEETSTLSNEAATILILEIVRIAKYIFGNIKSIRDDGIISEEIVYRLSYGSGRGIFHKQLVQMIIKKFNAYEKKARRLIQIANIENKCLFQASALAYPKPEATQILCQNREYSCPNIVNGWDINIVAPQKAYAKLGRNVDAGNYPKCKLSKQLELL